MDRIERIEEGQFIVIGHWEWDAIASALEAAGLKGFIGDDVELDLTLGLMSVPEGDLPLFSDEDAALRVRLVGIIATDP